MSNQSQVIDRVNGTLFYGKKPMINWKSDPKSQILNIINKMGPRTQEVDLYMILTDISHYISFYSDYNEEDEQMADELDQITSEWEEELVYVSKEDLLNALNKAKDYLLKKDSLKENKKHTKKVVKLTEEKLRNIISECIKHYICEGHWDDETDPVKLAEMYKHCLIRFDNALKNAIESKGGLDRIKTGEVILTIGTLGWRYYDSEQKALKTLRNKYYKESYKRDAANSIQCFFRSSHSNYNHEYVFVKGNEKPKNLWGDISRGW